MADQDRPNPHHAVIYHVQHLHTQATTIQNSYIQTIEHGPQAQNDQGPGQVERDSPGSTALESDMSRQPQPMTPYFQAEEGWVRLSENIFMNNTQPLRRGSSVYKGKQKHAGGWRDVAIKLLQHDKRNFNEIKLLLKLENHPNVIRVYESDVIKNGPTPQIYIVMELCLKNLNDYVEDTKEKSFDFDTAFSYAKQIVGGVAFIHRNSVLHRDLKLENILLAPDKKNIRVTDFGLSKLIDEGQSVDPVCTPGLGTYGYQAPEMYSASPDASFYSDTFSIGITLFALFSNGGHPFGKDKYRWRSNIIDNKRRDFSGILRFEPSYKREQLIDLLKCSLKHNRRDRPKPEELLNHTFFTEENSESRRGLLVSKFTSFFNLTSAPQVKTQPPLSKGDNTQETSLTNTERIHHFEDTLDKSSLLKTGYARAVDMLQEVRTMRGSLSLDRSLQLAECELYLQRGQEQYQLNNVRLMCKENTHQQLEEKANLLKDSGHATRAMILYTMMDDFEADKQSPDKVVKDISDRVFTIRRIIRPLLEVQGRHRDIAIQYGLTHIIDLLSKLRGVKGATPILKIPQEALCLAQIASINGEVGDTTKSLNVCQEGVKLLEDQFGELKENYRGYSWLMFNMGAAYHDSEQHESALKCTEKSIESNAKATDYDNEALRKEFFEIASRNLTKFRLSS